MRRAVCPMIAIEVTLNHDPFLQLFTEPVLIKMYETDPDTAMSISPYARDPPFFGMRSRLTRYMLAPPNAGNDGNAECELGRFPACRLPSIARRRVGLGDPSLPL